MSGSGPRDVLELRVPGGPPVRLLFVEANATWFVVPSADGAAWFSAAAREGRCTVQRSGSAPYECATQFVDDPEVVGALPGAFDAKYGPGTWQRYFRAPQLALALRPREAPPALSDSERLRREFDAVATTYDGRVRRHAIDSYLKDRVRELALATFRGHDPLLEIGAGTGIHTEPLLAAGHSVLAVDVSERMIAQLRARTERGGGGSRLTTRVGSLAGLAELLGDLPVGTFDGAFSAFGALDLEGELTGPVRALARLLRPGGRLAFAGLNRPGLTPVAWDLLLGRPRAAGARWSAEVPPGRLRFPLRLFPRNVRDWDALLAGPFRRRGATAVSVVAPPFDSDRLVGLLGARGTTVARSIDRRWADRRLGVASAEWVFLEYDRTDAPPR